LILDCSTPAHYILKPSINELPMISKSNVLPFSQKNDCLNLDSDFYVYLDFG
jgi:hypothetical protein